jgi:hypothetical protein
MNKGCRKGGEIELPQRRDNETRQRQHNATEQITSTRQDNIRQDEIGKGKTAQKNTTQHKERGRGQRVEFAIAINDVVVTNVVRWKRAKWALYTYLVWMRAKLNSWMLVGSFELQYSTRQQTRQADENHLLFPFFACCHKHP